jgi:phosphoribosylglycinamide formyltransferase-1
MPAQRFAQVLSRRAVGSRNAERGSRYGLRAEARMTNRSLFVLLSGRGSNFIAIHEAIRRGELNASIAGVLSNVPDAPGLQKAKEFGYPVHSIPHKGKDRRAHELEVEKVIDAAAPRFIVLAGYMRLLGPEFIAKYRHRILNIHPALLPSFPGVHAQKQAFDYGVRISGCTVHFVDEGTDTGPVIHQKAVPVYDTDTLEDLEARILEQEHRAYAEAIGLLLDSNWAIRGRRFVIA